MGSNFSGKSVSATFDGQAATLLYTGPTQINLVVPPALGTANTAANLVVTVDGAASAPQLVQLAPAWPSIFSNGVLNQDYGSNGAGQPARAGEVLQVFATGIPANATVSVKIGSQGNLVPLYAGLAPDVPGVQQVNVSVPDGTPSGAVPMTICAAAGTQQYCSSPVNVIVQ